MQVKAHNYPRSIVEQLGSSLRCARAGGLFTGREHAGQRVMPPPIHLAASRVHYTAAKQSTGHDRGSGSSASIGSSEL